MKDWTAEKYDGDDDKIVPLNARTDRIDVEQVCFKMFKYSQHIIILFNIHFTAVQITVSVFGVLWT